MWKEVAKSIGLAAAGYLLGRTVEAGLKRAASVARSKERGRSTKRKAQKKKKG